MNAKPVARWRIISASAPGTAHLEKTLPCQDAHAFCVLPGGELLAAVSDGAGSAEHTREGANLAVEGALAGLNALCQHGTPDDKAGWQAAITNLFAEVRQELASCADAADIPLPAFATTLTCALVTGDWLVVGHIGDGAAIAEDADNVLFLAACPQRGEYANETYFLTQPNAAGYTVVYAARRAVRALALTTDGLLRLAFKLPGYEPHPRFFHPLFTFTSKATNLSQTEAELAAFLASEQVCARTDDDKTLLLAIRTDSPDGRAVQRTHRRRKDVGV